MFIFSVVLHIGIVFTFFCFFSLVLCFLISDCNCFPFYLLNLKICFYFGLPFYLLTEISTDIWRHWHLNFFKAFDLLNTVMDAKAIIQTIWSQIAFILLNAKRDMRCWSILMHTLFCCSEINFQQIILVTVKVLHCICPPW